MKERKMKNSTDLFKIEMRQYDQEE